MTDNIMDFSNRRGAVRPELFDTRRMRDALADELKRRYPVGTRKQVEREFRLSVDEARSACNGSAGPGTLDRMWRRGGWDLVIPVFTRLLAEGLDQHLERERRRHADLAEDLGETIRSVRLAADRGAGRGPRMVAAERRSVGSGYPETADGGEH